MSVIYYGVTSDRVVEIEADYIFEETEDSIVFWIREIGSVRLDKNILYADRNLAEVNLTRKLQGKSTQPSETMELRDDQEVDTLQEAD